MYFWLGVSETSTRYTYEPRILGEKFRGILNIIGRTQVSIPSSKIKSEKETLFRMADTVNVKIHSNDQLSRCGGSPLCVN